MIVNEICAQGRGLLRKKQSADRLAIFLPSLEGGGAERVCLNLASGFVSRGFNVDLLLASARGHYLTEISENIRVVALGAARPLRVVPALARYLAHEPPKGLLATITNANLAALWAIRISGCSVPCIVREASTLSTEIAQSPWLNRFLLPRFLRHSLRFAHAIVAPSHGVADDLAQVTGVLRESINVIYNPVISQALLERAREPTEHPWLQKGDIPVVIGVGRLTEQKDFSTLFYAFARCQEKAPRQTAYSRRG